MRLQLVLEVLRRDVLPAGRDDDVLLAIRDHEEAVVVEVPDVAGMHEAFVVERRARRLVVAVVAGEDGVRAEQDLAVVGDPDLDAGQRLADGAELEGRRAVDGRGGRHLGEPVALEHEDVDRVEELGDLARERRAAGVRDAQAAAEPLLDLRVDEPVGDPVLDSAGRAGQACFACRSCGDAAADARAPSRRSAVPRPVRSSKPATTAAWIFS